MTYYLYHIPGKKIGVTRDLNTRLTVYQGYKPHEYKVLEQSDDIDYISEKEIELHANSGLQNTWPPSYLPLLESRHCTV